MRQPPRARYHGAAANRLRHLALRCPRPHLGCGLWRRGALLALAALALPDGRAAAEQAAPAADTPAPSERRLEYALVPFAGGDTDIGFGVGAIAGVARVDRGFRPFRWNLQGASFVTFRDRNGFESPYQDAFVKLVLNGLLDGRGRLELRPSFTRETNLRYYGIGNASVAPAQTVPARDFITRVHPAVILRLRYALRPPLQLLFGTLFTHTWIDYPPDSQLAHDLREGSPRVRSLLHVDRNHGLHLLEAALIYDTRDDEVSASAGHYHMLKVRGSPWRTGGLPHRYLQIDVATRYYRTVWPDRLVLAVRLVGDLQIGSVPFYELARYDEASAIGGAHGVRGVPRDRYRGKRKLFANLEARATLAHFTVHGSRYGLGLTAFFDSGRVWADDTSAPELDGTGVGLKYGTGAGLRVQKGQSFVLRVDVAWSPDARPLGFYFLADQLF
jgi:hypothetical protein